ncbi:MAG: filamentous hemagglutinin N-terminal domain-containing protein, partial [Leptolyngbyaceae cyanobacterium SL_7_1]|nr:filamentous hemagglutinin N-terminal domain-containing protein [Leptolyngbyaceae cyanobacterium SL_7_1]
MKLHPALLLLTTLTTSALVSPALAQSIAPANDGTGTVVTRHGSRYDISGGQRPTPQHLFHSFESFGLSRQEIARFLSQPNIDHILARVVGGEVSLIEGLLQVSGGDANLYLMNPAGIIFGQEARLDVPASFTATTATGIGLEEGWFPASGAIDFSTLSGDPNQFTFAATEPGAIVNAGELVVSQGENLTLLGGTVVNTGTLSAPGGQVVLTAVPGENRVRLSQAGMLLSLEVKPIASSSTNLPSPVSLPELL